MCAGFPALTSGPGNMEIRLAELSWCRGLGRGGSVGPKPGSWISATDFCSTDPSSPIWDTLPVGRWLNSLCSGLCHSQSQHWARYGVGLSDCLFQREVRIAFLEKCRSFQRHELFTNNPQMCPFPYPKPPRSQPLDPDANGWQIPLPYKGFLEVNVFCGVQEGRHDSKRPDKILGSYADAPALNLISHQRK